MKNSKYYLAFALITFFIVFLFFEILLRVIPPMSSGSGTTIGRYWMDENWHPVNTLGYRDFEHRKLVEKDVLIFLGDSFTAGHGVVFQKTYYFKIREMLQKRFYGINLGDSGSSTKTQIKNLHSFTNDYPNLKYSAVVHQYFGNDIEDFIEMPEVGRSRYSKYLGKISLVWDLIASYLMIKDFSAEYHKRIYNAYSNEKIKQMHTEDLQKLHKKINSLDSKLIFLIFPFLQTEEEIVRSAVYIKELENYFHNNCSRGDALIDVSKIAMEFDNSERTVNMMDAHPSEALHDEVYKALLKLFNDTTESNAGVKFCSRN